MEHGFPPASHHGPNYSGGTAAAGLEYDATTEAATAAKPATAGHNDESTEEPQHGKKDTNHNITANMKQLTDLIFNYSSVTLTEPMKKLLNRALNFAILPLKLDITEVLVDFKKFSRSVIWHEYWHGKEADEKFTKPIFKTQKSNLPQNHNTPAGLKTYLNSVKSEIMDPRNRNIEKCNLPQDELNALKDLIKLQRERIITIKACDKGAGLIILDFNTYMRACYDHLLSKQPNQTGPEPQSYYKKQDEFALERAKKHIENVLKEALNEGIIDKAEFSAMNPEDETPSQF